MHGGQVAGSIAQNVARCRVKAGGGEGGEFAGLRAPWKRALLSGVVPGPRGILAAQSGVVSSFLIVWSDRSFLMCSLLDGRVE
jgi:hypothetical protein